MLEVMADIVSHTTTFTTPQMINSSGTEAQPQNTTTCSSWLLVDSDVFYVAECFKNI